VTDVKAQLISWGTTGGIREGDYVHVGGDLARVTDTSPVDDTVDVVTMRDGFETTLWLRNLAEDDGIDTAPSRTTSRYNVAS
jgi:hypothetical protein